MRIEITKEHIETAGKLARRCSAAAARERVLVSQAVALAFRAQLEQASIAHTSDGRSSATCFVDLLDICDFGIGVRSIEVRAMTNVDRPALLVPTIPMMVGVLSDLYMCARVDADLSGATLLGFSTREDLANAELSSNGLFAILAEEDLRPMSDLVSALESVPSPAPEVARAFDEWQQKADVVISGMGELFLSAGLTREEYQARVASAVRDAFLSIYGDSVPETGLEPVFESLFRRFGLRQPLRARPGEAVAFENSADDHGVAKNPSTARNFFRDNLSVRDRVALYRHLIEDEAALADHQRARRALDHIADGVHLAAAPRRERVRKRRSAWAETQAVPPPRTAAKKEKPVVTRPADSETPTPNHTRLEDLVAGASVRGILPDTVTIVSVSWPSANIVDLVYKDTGGRLGSELLYRERESSLEVVGEGSPWSFDGDAASFRLVSEAHRIGLAHLFDPLLAVHTSLVQPLPHQITAVYGEMLPRQPLRFLLADDPGAGKTIMTGLLIRELVSRGDLHRCLIVAPGSLVEQWQEELYSKFHLRFEILSREMAEAAAANVFDEKNLLICRLDQLSRNESLQEKLRATDWDLIVCDESHKMSASRFGGEVKRTKRYDLGMTLGDLTRHFLLLTATPHNGKEEDFQLFMALLDGDRFEGQIRDGSQSADVSDLMRRMVKEQLVKFDGTPLFPERFAYTVQYELSAAEARLYSAVTDYVREGMNRAERLAREGDAKRGNVIGFALTILQRRLASSPEAIYQSLRRRTERLQKRLREEEIQRRGAILRDDLIAANRIGADLEDIDDFYDESAADEIEEIEEQIVDQATAASTIEELRAEIGELEELVRIADEVRRSGADKKWEELRSLLVNDSSAEAASEIFDGEGRMRKIIIFTEHRDTLNYLAAKIRRVIGRDEAVVTIHGGTGRDERRATQGKFTNDKETLVLVATDAAGEGINLQRAHLMVNYDLPWNPNRIEQRFGRIHRIGQQEVCHLWNLVASETREGDVFARLFTKLKQQRETLGGSVFDVLGKCFTGDSLRKLLIEAVRYGDRPDVKEKLFQRVDENFNTDHVQDLLDERALAHETLSPSRIQEIRDQMERAEAQKLQPHFIGSFFREAFARLGGRMHPREPGLFEISFVPAALRNRIRQIGVGEPVFARYERVAFDKQSIAAYQRQVTLLCPGHPLLDAVIDIVKEQNRELLKRGALLIDPSDPGVAPRVLFYIEHSLQDARTDESGNRRVVSRELQFVEVSEDGRTRLPGIAPYLDYRPASAEELAAMNSALTASWLRQDIESRAVGYAAEHLVPAHLERVRSRRTRLIDKTEGEVRTRLLSEINHWEHRSDELRLREQAGARNAKLNSDQAQQRADGLRSRLKRRLEELKEERFLSPLAPNVFGGALVVPQGLVDQLMGMTPVDSEDPVDRARIDRLAVDAVMRAERGLGNSPIEMPHHNAGYDVESRDGATGRLRFIEVKGKAPGSRSITISKSQIVYGLNAPDEFILAIVTVDGDSASTPLYVRRAFRNELDFAVTSVNFELTKLIEMGAPPS